MSKFVLHKYGEGWEFAPEGLFSRKVIENRVVRKKISQAKQKAVIEAERCQTLTDEMLGKYEQAVLVDNLTELYNTRTFFKRLSYELKRAKRYKRPLALLIISIDRLSHYANDYSVMIVDDIRRASADFIKRTMRDVDFPARLGENHFAVLLPETYASRAVAAAERIRSELSSQPLNDALRNIRLTASIGVVSFPTHGREENELILKALDFHDLAQRQGGDNVISG